MSKRIKLKEKIILLNFKRRLEGAINQFTRQFKIRAYLDNEFYCISEKRKIAFSVLSEVATDELFLQNWVEKHGNENIQNVSLFFLSLLHEIGHIAVPHDEPAEESDLREDYQKMVKTKGKFTEGNLAYFNLPSEIKATKWANTFLKYHQEECIRFDDKIQKIVISFFEKLITDWKE